MDFNAYIRDVEDFPKSGIIFKDITPLLNNPEVLAKASERFIDFLKERALHFTNQLVFLSDSHAVCAIIVSSDRQSCSSIASLGKATLTSFVFTLSSGCPAFPTCICKSNPSLSTHEIKPSAWSVGPTPL